MIVIRQGIRLWGLFLCGFFLISHCRDPEKGVQESQVEIGYINVEPGVVARSGPGIKNPAMKIIRENTEVNIIKRMTLPEETLLGLRGGWCQVQDGKFTGWIFCPLLHSSAEDLGYIVVEARAVHKNSDEFKKIAGLDRCLELTPESLPDFRGGCLGNPCFHCRGEMYKKDGTLVYLDETVSGCKEFGAGSWKFVVETQSIEAEYNRSEHVFPHDVCITDEHARAQIREDGMSRFGKLEGLIRVRQVLILSGDGVELDQSAYDPGRIEGKDDMGVGLNERRKGICFYPLSEVSRFSNY